MMKNDRKLNVYDKAQRLANITKQLIATGNIRRAKNYFAKVEDVFSTGTPEIRNAILNVYLHSIANFMEMHRCNIKELLPANLLHEYRKQINFRGI